MRRILSFILAFTVVSIGLVCKQVTGKCLYGSKLVLALDHVESGSVDDWQELSELYSTGPDSAEGCQNINFSCLHWMVQVEEP